MPNFIEIISQTTTGVLGGLPRLILIVSRESITGYTPDPATGLFKFVETDVSGFETANPGSIALINALRTVFSGAIKPDAIYVLSTDGDPITNADLDKANVRPRDWSFITLASETQGILDEADFIADLGIIATWCTPAKEKIFVATFSAEESGNAITLPPELLLGGSIGSNPNGKVLISDTKHELDPYTTAYDNVWLAILPFVLYGGILARSWGSLSDAHDFAYVSSDSYSTTVRNFIEAQSLTQYNGAKDKAGSVFMYNTQMGSGVNPPDSLQIESQAAIYLINDRAYVDVHNTFQAAGQIGLTNDDPGIQKFAARVDKSLRDSFDVGLILAQENGQPDYILEVKTAAQVTQLSPNWQQTGIWPAGVAVGKIRPFGAAHYVTIVFQYQ